ncbi:response regulator [Cohnella ginsengisoli]|uniref:response regulator n=1 Tax=Cohnella ginsengisoli TaxID=425004 RepID=UPI0030B8A13D
MYYLMIVEDELKLQNNLAYNMGWEDHGIEVVGAAASGEEALLLIPLRKPDLMIIDIEMQGMDGLQLMQAVREIDPDIRFIVLSGHDDFEFVQKALRCNADNYLLKPAGNPDVVAAVLESTERIKAERAQKYGMELLQRRWKEHLPELQKKLFAALGEGLRHGCGHGEGRGRIHAGAALRAGQALLGRGRGPGPGRGIAVGFDFGFGGDGDGAGAG